VRGPEGAPAPSAPAPAVDDEVAYADSFGLDDDL